MKFTGPRVKLSRRLGIPLTPKAIRYMERKPYPPGEHGANQRRMAKMSDYKRQLMEKQRLKAQYNLSERQLRNYVRRASHTTSNTETSLIRILESRLDAMVLRAGFARTIYSARQLVLHGHIRVNGKWVNMPSQRLRVKDVVSVKPGSRTIQPFQQALEEMVASPPGYLERNKEEMTAQMVYLPERAEVPVSCAVQLVIEYYSR
jgi:small subunit ribosomal protein S4